MVIKHRFLTRRVDRLIGPVLSAALGIAMAFFLLTVPGEVLAWVLVAPAPDVVTRLVVALIAGLLAGGASMALFLWLDHQARPKAPEESDDWDFEAVDLPITRGDAPPRPIFAGTELAARPAPASAPEPAALAIEEEDEEAEDALELGMALTPDVEAALAPAGDGPAAEHASLDELMQRLELGIAGRGPRPLAEETSDASRTALRDALEELQRMAARSR